MLICGLGALAWFLYLKRVDVYARKRGRKDRTWIYFLAGALSAPLALYLYRWIYLALMDGYGEVSNFLDCIGIIGPTEELSKFLVFFLVTKLFCSIADPMSAVIGGASVGLGFSIVENALYSLDGDALIPAFRSIFNVASHMSWSAIAAFSYGARVFYKDRDWSKRTRWFIPVGLLSASYLHGVIDLLLMSGGYGFYLGIDLYMATFVVLFIAIGKSRKLSPYYGFALKDYGKALRTIESSIRRDPKNWALHYRRGVYALCGGWDEEAREAFEDAMLLTENPYPRVMLAYVECMQKAAGAKDFLVDALGPFSEQQRKGLLRDINMVMKARKRALKEASQERARDSCREQKKPGLGGRA